MTKLNRTTANITSQHPLRVIQFGEGNFLRAFVDWIFESMNEQGLFNGSIQLVQPIDRGLADLINKQDGLYHVFTRGVDKGELKKDVKLIKSVLGCLNPYTEFDAYLKLAEVDTADVIISNTTEAGIAFNGDDKLEDKPASSYPGKLTQLLHHRFVTFKGDKSKGFSIIPCELINNNGEELKKCILQYAELWQLGDAFVSWINEANSFYNTLVDRIVPGFPKDNLEEYHAEAGFDDQIVVAAEHFHLWVIEGDDKLAAKIPFDKSGLNVKLVDSIQPFRTRKVRILNGAHTTMVPLSLLHGNEIVQQTVEETFTKDLVHEAVYNEIVDSLTFDKEELKEFAAVVLDRFRNPFVVHQLASIALNSVSKFKVRVLPSILEYKEINGKLPKTLVFSFAALIRFYKGEIGGRTLPVNDDAAVMDTMKAIWANGSAEDVAKATLSNVDFWGQDLTAVEGLTDLVAKCLTLIDSVGVEKAYAEL